jgi:hypothetical protein
MQQGRKHPVLVPVSAHDLKAGLGRWMLPVPRDIIERDFRDPSELERRKIVRDWPGRLIFPSIKRERRLD